jgi:hypothetical protein
MFQDCNTIMNSKLSEKLQEIGKKKTDLVVFFAQFAL